MSGTDNTRLRRGLILQALHSQYPYALTSPALGRQVGMFYMGDERGLTRDLAYLEERQLLGREEAAVGAIRVVTYKLTAGGLLVVEGVAADAGVEIVPA